MTPSPFSPEPGATTGTLSKLGAVELDRRRFLQLGAMTAGAATILSLAGPALSSYADTPIAIPNAGFETVTSGKPAQWTSTGNGTIASVSTPVHGGSWSVSVDSPNSTTTGSIRSAYVAASPDTVYRAAVQAWSVAGVSRLYIEFWNSTKTTRLAITQGVSAATGVWEEVITAMKSPAGTAFISILLDHDRTNPGLSYFDDVVLTQLSGLMPIPNAGFEIAYGTAIGNWNIVSGGEIASSTAVAHGGTRSARLTSNNAAVTANTMLRSAYIPIEPDTNYEAAIQVYNAPGTGMLYLEFYTAARVRILALRAAAYKVREWQQIVVRGKSPANAAFATVAPYVGYPSPGTVYFDDATLTAISDETPRTFSLAVSGYPRLNFTAAELPALQAKAASTAATPLGPTGAQLWANVITAADAFLAETTFHTGLSIPLVQSEWPTGSNFPYWTAISRLVQERMETLAVAYAVTGDTDYRDKLLNAFVLPLCGFSSFQDVLYPGGYSTLSTCHLTFGLCLAFDTIQGTLTSAQRAQVLAAIEDLGAEPIFKDAINNDDGNGMGLRAAGLATSGCILLGESSRANAYLTRATDLMETWLDLRMTSGQMEGHLYLGYVTEVMYRAADQVRRTTGETYAFDHEFTTDVIIPYAMYFLAPGGAGMAPVGDTMAYTMYQITMGMLNSDTSNAYREYAGWYLGESQPDASSLDRFLTSAPGGPVGSPDDLPPSWVSEDWGWAALRSGWDKEDGLLAFISSPSNLEHTHYDANHFVIATNKTWIVFDPGYQVLASGPLNTFSSGFVHNTLHVDGAGQRQKGGGKLTKKLLSPAVDVVIGDAVKAYDLTLSVATREVFYVRPHYWVMRDVAASSASRAFEWSIFPGPGSTYGVDGAVVAPGTYTGKTFNVQRGRATLSATFAGNRSIQIANYPGAEEFPEVAEVAVGTATSIQSVAVVRATPYERPGTFDAESLLPAQASSGKKVGVRYITGVPAVEYASTVVGDYITLRFSVPTAGTYALAAHLLCQPGGGQVQFALDGVSVGSTFDAFASRLLLKKATIGTVSLSAGTHDLKFTVSGKNASSGGWQVGIEAVQALNTAAPAVSPFNPVWPVTQITGTGATGVEVARDEPAPIVDRLLWRTTTGSVSGSGVTFSSDSAVVSTTATSLVERYAMINGTALAFGSQTLVSASGACTISGLLGTGSSAGVEGGFASTAARTVSVHSRVGSPVTVDGATVSATWNATTKLVQFAIPAGEHSFSIG